MKYTFFLLLPAVACGQNAWTRRKSDSKAKEEEEAPTTDFAKLHKMVENMNQPGAVGGQQDTEASELLDQAFGMWEGILDSPEVNALLSDENALRAAMLDNPLIKSIPGASEQVEALMQTDAFKDPDQFKQRMKEGMEAFKAVSKDVASEIGTQFQDLIQNPDKLQETMAQAMQTLGVSQDDLAKASEGLMNAGGGNPLLDGLPGMADMMNNPEFKEQMEQAQAYLSSIMGKQDTAPGENYRPRKRNSLDLEDQVEIEIPDAINSRV